MQIWLIVFAATLLTTTMLLRVFSNWVVIHHGYEISRATERQEQLVRDNDKLRSDLARLKSPAQLAMVVAQDFGLAAVDPGQIRRIQYQVTPPLPDGQMLAQRRVAQPKLAGW